MRRPPLRYVLWLAAAAVVMLALGAFAFWFSSTVRLDAPITESGGAIVATGTVQAPLPGETTASANAPETTATSSTPSAEAAAAAAAAQKRQTPLTQAPQTQEVAPAPSTSEKATNPYATPPAMSSNIWPARLGKFAAAIKVPVWYPKQLPKGYKVLSCDTVEMEAGSGLVADTVFSDGNGGLNLVQGSPTKRSYEIISIAKVPWGTQQADVVYQDPQDTTSPRLIVYSKGGNFAELSGDVTLEQLKAVAASMVPVH
jgi:hypothetical protein